jgi:hypothetical protein
MEADGNLGSNPLPDVADDDAASRTNLTELANENSLRGYAAWLLIYAAKNPWDFVYYVILCLSPFLIFSLFASMKMYRDLESKNKEKKRRARHSANASKVRRGKTD